MVDYPNNPPAGQSGTRTFGTVLRNALDPFSDPTTTRLAQNDYAAGLQPATAQGSGSSAPTAAAAAPPASTASPGALATTQNAPPARMDLGYRAPDSKAAAASAASPVSPIHQIAAATPFQALPSSWQSKLHETFGSEAPTRYESFRANAATLAGGAAKDRLTPRTPQEQMESDFADIAAGRGVAPSKASRDYRTTPASTVDPLAINGPYPQAYPGSQVFGPGQTGEPAVARPGPSGTIFDPNRTIMTPHVPSVDDRFTSRPGPTGGGLTPSELTATDVFGQAQAEGPGVVGGPAGGPPAPGGLPDQPPNPNIPDPRLRPPGMMAEQPIGPGSSITVKPGDNLWTIARTYLGDPTKAKDIAQLNHIRHPSMIHPGLVIRLPGGSDPANVATPNMRPGAPAAAPPPQPPPTQPPDLAGGTGSDIGQMGQPDELDDLTHAAATRAHEILGQASLNDMDEYPFHPGGGGVVTPPPGSASSTTSRGVDLSGTTGGRSSFNMQGAINNPELPGSDYQRELHRYDPPGGRGATLDGGGTDVAALSDNDNRMPGWPGYVPAGRSILPYQPNVMPDYFRGTKPLPVSKPANQAGAGGTNRLAGGTLKDILKADDHTYYGPPESVAKRWQIEDDINVAKRQGRFHDVLGGAYQLKDGTLKQPSFDLSRKREAPTERPPRGDPYPGPPELEPPIPANGYSGWDPSYNLLGLPLSNFHARMNVMSDPTWGRPDHPWLSHSPTDPGYGVEAEPRTDFMVDPGQLTKQYSAGLNRAEREGRSPYTAYSPWSYEYNFFSPEELRDMRGGPR